MNNNKIRKVYDPVINLNRQFHELMANRGIQRVSGDRFIRDGKGGGWEFVTNRYKHGTRLYQMQVDYMYVIKDVVDRGRNPYFVKLAQKFIDDCAVELARMDSK